MRGGFIYCLISLATIGHLAETNLVSFSPQLRYRDSDVHDARARPNLRELKDRNPQPNAVDFTLSRWNQQSRRRCPPQNEDELLVPKWAQWTDHCVYWPVRLLARC